MWELPWFFLLVSYGYAATITYNWDVTWVSVDPDGFRRPAIGINGKWPCPEIRGNVGDEVVVNLKNQLGNETTSLHFHGIAQIGTNEMDGPSQVTQCPIPGDGSITYKFLLDSPGTYWYHSHDSGQYPDGLRGPLIVEDPKDPYAGKYDEEIVMTLSDWYHEQAPILISEMLSLSNPDALPPTVDSALINDTATPAKLSFAPGKTYKIRLINMSAFASAMVDFDHHIMKIIEIDGVYTAVKNAQQIRIAPAQRYTFLMTADPTGNVNYEFLVALDINRDYTAPGAIYELNATGQLIYDSKKAPAKPLIVHSWNPIDDLTLSPLDMQPALSPIQDVLEMNFTLATDNLGVPRAWINGQTYVMQKVPSLYTTLTTGPSASNPVVYGQVNPFVVQPNQIVEIVLNNLNDAIHPFHLHGHKFQTLARPPSNSGCFNGKTVGFPTVPMIRDTVHVMPNSYVVLRFLADNPGIQLFHCHIEWHVDMGLVATIIESPSILQDTIKIPADHLAACKAQNIPTAGNAAGNTQNLLDLKGANTVPPYPDYGALIEWPSNPGLKTFS